MKYYVTLFLANFTDTPMLVTIFMQLFKAKATFCTRMR